MVENSLFNQPLMNRYLKKYKKELKLTHTKKTDVIKWIKKLENGELKDEVSNYGLFSRLILESLLGYDYEENIEENVKEDYGRGFSEFAMKKDGKKFMVIELKGSDTDLDKPQQRKNDKRTPVDQAFDYAKRSGDINWILVSNYDEFRLYNWHKKQHQYISFKAEELKDPETFKSFMLVLSKFSTIENNLIEKLVSKTIFVERDLEAEFYKLFNETRLMLIAEIEHIHPEFTRDQSVHYSQLILNRYIFICFAEDLGLLPEEISVGTIETPIKNENLGRSEIWHRLNGLFLDVNEGSDLKKEKIYGYNGGLFKKDLEFLNIRDVIDDHSIFQDAYQKWKFEEYSLIVEAKLGRYSGKINPIYKNLMTISTFNFSSEVDVNILGHIFENSIGDIEELKADEKGRRKKDGIFYTPEYITDYICRNTIIPYLSKSGKSNTVKSLMDEYWGSEIEELYEKVKNIKIVDPACGSGAFLNKASDILLEIHQAIHKEQYKEDKTLMPYFDNIKERRKILLNNIYGVDLNEESVEITKLSLFLKVCRKGLKLPNLDNNIKCGNSLIDDPKYTDKPFRWEKEYTEICSSGGFDIVIGNPPYVRQEKIKEIKPYLKKNYKVYTGVADLFVYFFEKGLNLLKDSGMFAFICSDRFTNTNYGQKTRKLILDNEFKEYIYHSENTFESAVVLSCTTIIKKGKPSNDNKIRINNEFEIQQNKLDDGFWSFEKPEIMRLREKIEKQSIELQNIPNLKIYSGIKTGLNKAFMIDLNTRNKLIQQDFKNNEIIKPLLRGIDIQRWKMEYSDRYIILSKSGMELENSYPSLFDFMKNNEIKLKDRSDQGEFWYNLRDCAYYDKFEKEKIIWTEMTPKPSFLIDKEKYFLLNTSYMLIIDNENFNLNYVTALLNSNLLFWIFLKMSPKLYGQRLRFIHQYVKKLPIYPANPEKQQPLINATEKILNKNNELQKEINSFKHWIQKEFNVEKLSKKLNKYYELSKDEFIDELHKKKVDTKSRKNREYLEREFDDSLNIINPLLDTIKKIDNEIDLMVYELYGLNKDEIQIIEDSLKKMD
ncbi:Eco57I restriction-modification methylase domain-containing protein [Methanobacterium formicicum]|uniref:site-specific DNA-methyltransferase (adenine-specific) n=1 Tax=Methanobacterium formicicum TaxID=2162 RepID=A0A090I4W8_METFO|nr:TaqI-like C-terminal specificity domain-containing protein [Methanobacterium formicicum]MDH2660051.1 TaqI-like C-terminal specificity domain-containing protein [Methanobacterium formicicum]CEA14528.1 hypothetical protein DSM1535_2208 [Methanobacterium formicicum]